MSELSPLAGLTGLMGLSLDNTQVSELSPLAELTGLMGLWLNNTQVSELSPLAGLTGLTVLSLDNTRVLDLRVLRKLERLATTPENDGLTFEGCAAALADPRIAEIAAFKRPKQRARTLFDYLEHWVPPVPPEVPAQSRTGLRYRIGDSGMVDYDPTARQGITNKQQLQLHRLLIEDVSDLLVSCDGGNQPFARLSRKLERYRDALGAAPDAINLEVLWAAGNTLRVILRADVGKRPGDMSDMPVLDADRRGMLDALVTMHNAFSAQTPGLAELDVAGIDSAERHRAAQDRAVVEKALEAFAAQTRLTFAPIVEDLRALHAEAAGTTVAAGRAQVIGDESLENLIKAVVLQAILEARGESFAGKVVGDARATLVGVAVATLGSDVAATYPHLVAQLHPQIAAVMAALHGKDYPLMRAVDWVKAKVGSKKKPGRRQ